MGFGSAPWVVAEPWPSPMGRAGDGLGRVGPEGSWVMGRNIFKVFSPSKPSPARAQPTALIYYIKLLHLLHKEAEAYRNRTPYHP